MPELKESHLARMLPPPLVVSHLLNRGELGGPLQSLLEQPHEQPCEAVKGEALNLKPEGPFVSFPVSFSVYCLFTVVSHCALPPFGAYPLCGCPLVLAQNKHLCQNKRFGLDTAVTEG